MLRRIAIPYSDTSQKRYLRRPQDLCGDGDHDLVVCLTDCTSAAAERGEDCTTGRTAQRSAVGCMCDVSSASVVQGSFKNCRIVAPHGSLVSRLYGWGPVTDFASRVARLIIGPMTPPEAAAGPPEGPWGQGCECAADDRQTKNPGCRSGCEQRRRLWAAGQYAVAHYPTEACTEREMNEACESAWRGSQRGPPIDGGGSSIIWVSHLKFHV